MNVLSGLYGAGLWTRNTLFDHGLLKTSTLAKPVISIGNLSVGGSGKTPFVMTIGKLLAERGIRYDILSRGYGRRSRGVRIVDLAGPALEFGDEPLLLARRLHAPVVVGESRYDAGCLAEQRFDSQIHLLDDGFQHRSLQRDFDVVLLNQQDLGDRLLPVGRLREPLTSLRRADAVVVPAEISAGHSELAVKCIWRMRRAVELDNVPPMPLAFCGIARPQQFFSSLAAVGISLTAERAFRDHHQYTRADLESLQVLRREHGGGGFITTEKDAINLGPLLEELSPVAIAKLEIILEKPIDVIDTILARIAESRPCS